MTFFVAGLSAPVTAQDERSLLVQAVEEATGAPLVAVLVSIKADGGRADHSRLSDAGGRAWFSGVDAGRYRVEAERIGYESVEVLVEVRQSGTTYLEVGLTVRAIQLEGLRVEGNSRCVVRPGGSGAVADVWQETRKALERTRWTVERGVYAFRTRHYSRSVEEEMGRIMNPQERTTEAWQSTPFASRPVEDLLVNGFVQDEDGAPGGTLFYAPDANVLLADQFLDTHCMRLQPGTAAAGLVGLSFEPVSGRTVPDIRGTLWVDTSNWHLRRLEYTYVNLPWEVATRGIGGEVVFRAMPNGTWIIPRWEIRGPWLAVGSDAEGREVLYQYGVQEDGGVVLSVREPGGQVLFTAETAALEGVVIDRNTDEAVEGARVKMEGRSDSAITDQEGRFRFANVPAGSWVVAANFEHAVEPTAASIVLEGGTVAALALHLDVRRPRVDTSCPEAQQTGAVVGRVVDRGTGVGLAGSRVQVNWSSSGGVGIARSVTADDGSFEVCGLPRGELLRLSASWLGRVSVSDTMRLLPEVSTLFQEIVIGAGTSATVHGQVEGWTDRAPVPAASVRMTPLGRDASSSDVTTTDANGRFALRETGPGDYLLEVSSLGYFTVVDTVEVLRERANHIRVRLPEDPIELDEIAVEVEARLHRLEETGYYERRQAGLGLHLDAGGIRERLPATVPELLDATLGVRVANLAATAGARQVVVIRGCLPAIYVDGALARPAGPFVRNPAAAINDRPDLRMSDISPLYLSDLVTAQEIAGMEVYRSPAEIPLQYGGMGSGEWGTQCGVILVWTH